MNSFDFASFIAQPGWDLMAQARLAWEYGTVFPGTQRERLTRDPDAWYDITAVGDFLEFGDVGVGVTAADAGPADFQGSRLFDGDDAPRVFVGPWADFFLRYYDQGSGYPAMTGGSLMRDIPFDASDGGNVACAYEDEFDMLVCHATLQWYPNHHILIPNLLRMMKSGGVFAASIPQFGGGMIARRPRAWVEGHPGSTTTQLQFKDAPAFTCLSAGEYDAIFRSLQWPEWPLVEHRIVETTYHATLQGVGSVEEWCERSGIREIVDYWDGGAYESRAQRERGEVGYVESELLKWLHAGNPTPVKDGIHVQYPFLLITAVCR